MDSWPRRWAELYPRTAVSEAVEAGALLLAEWGEGAQPAELRATLDRLGDGARRRLPAGWSVGPERKPSESEAVAAVAAVNAELFGTFGLAGDREDYYNPANSFLSAVLRRKRGIPITLSIIWEAVARRVGLRSLVLGRFPGHVLVRVPVGTTSDPSKDLYVDAFGADVLYWGDLPAFVQRVGASGAPEDLRRYIAPCQAKEVHARMLRNLRHIYEQRGERGLLLSILNQAITVDPDADLLAEHRAAAKEDLGARAAEL